MQSSASSVSLEPAVGRGRAGSCELRCQTRSLLCIRGSAAPSGQWLHPTVRRLQRDDGHLAKLRVGDRQRASHMAMVVCWCRLGPGLTACDLSGSRCPAAGCTTAEHRAVQWPPSWLCMALRCPDICLSRAWLQGFAHQMDQIPQLAPVCYCDRHKLFHWTQHWSSHLLQAGHYCQWQCHSSCRTAHSTGL